MSTPSEPVAGKTPMGDLLVDLFDRFDHGDNYWHAQISRLIADLTAPQAAWKPAPERHSIWAIVRHMIFWREYTLARLRDQPLPDTPAGNWTEPPSPGEDAWQAERERYRNVHRQLMDEVRSLNEERLHAELGRRDLRFYHLVVGLLAHDSYHAGQIAYLRALQGLPSVE